MRITSLLLLLPWALVSGAQTPDGFAVWARHCARCHEADKTGWAAPRVALAKLPPEAILANLNIGFMSLAASIDDDEKRAVAAFLTGKPVGAFQLPAPPEPKGMCADSPSAPDLLSGPRWNGWGVDPGNSRFQPAAMAGLTAAQVPRLKLKWAFGFPHAPAAWSQPVVAGGRVFVGSANGAVYSLDASTGCTRWIYPASPAGVRAAVVIGPGFGGARFAAYVGDLAGAVHAVDALTGKELWRAKVDDHPLARITGAPALHDGRLYVPVASIEEAAAMNPRYECCTFRGSVVALDARTGKQIWKTYLVPGPPRQTGTLPGGTRSWGPSGVAVWSSPAIDAVRGRLYVATGDLYSSPVEGHSDSILAMDLAGGTIVWSHQATKGDAWNVSCVAADKASCPKPEGPDLDFGSAPILQALPGGRQAIVAGQKSGVLHVLDPDSGTPLRQVPLGKGGLLGGIEWGPAAEAGRAYVAISDLDFNKPAAGGGLTAVQIATGEKLWHAPAPSPACLGEYGCRAAQPAAVTVIPGVVFSGSLDGRLRAYADSDGKLIWELDTRKSFATVNGVNGAGGSLNGAGPTVVNGMLFVNSGYGFLGGAPGNVLLAYSVQ